MREFLDDWLFPPAVARLRNETYLALRHGVFLTSRSADLSRNARFRNMHQGRRCFVIGNGPSLQTQDLSPLGGEITFVMNAFWKHPIVDKWQPTYCCMADPLLFDGSPPMNEFLQKLSASLHDSTFFVPMHSTQVVKKQGLLPPEQTFYVGFGGTFSRMRKVDLAGLIPGVQSTSLLSIMAAMYMGCSPIYLLGLDHDWLSHRGMDRHFYDGKTIEGHPQAHGDLSEFSYKADAQAIVNLWSSYEALLKSARQKRIDILNATNGGFLDVFERVKYEEVVGP